MSSESAATKSWARYACAPSMPAATGAAIDRMLQVGRDEPLEGRDELMHALGRQIETEEL